jgi:hypothetical protein
MMLIRIGHGARTGGAEPGLYRRPAPPLVQDAPPGWRLRHPWSRWSATGTKRATASALSPEISTSTDARSSGLSTNRPSHFEIAREAGRCKTTRPAAGAAADHLTKTSTRLVRRKTSLMPIMRKQNILWEK